MATRLDRRRFLGGGCALFALGGCDEAPWGFPTPTGDTGAAGTPTDPLTPLERYPCVQAVTPDASFSELPLASYPDLATVGGWYPVTLGGQALIVAHVYDGCYAAVVRACAHEGEPVNYVDGRKGFTCPRHGAVYAADGSRVSGPSATGLQRFPCARVGDSVFVRAG